MDAVIERLASAELIYLDTAPLIHLIEGESEISELVAGVIESMDRGEKRGLSSYITLLELLVKPFQVNRRDLAERYRSCLLEQPRFSVHDVGRRVAEEAARLRARYGSPLRTPDAIHLATARLHGADVFVTNDARLERIEEVPVLVLSDHIRE